MPDSEMFKLIINTGSFALLVLIVIWALMKGIPDHRTSVERMAADNRAAVEQVCRTHEVNMGAQMKTFESIVVKQLSDCREERKEILSGMVAEMKKEGELNRESRHESSQTLLKAVREVYKDSNRRDRDENGG